MKQIKIEELRGEMLSLINQLSAQIQTQNETIKMLAEIIKVIVDKNNNKLL
jgi:hypothetical protein